MAGSDVVCAICLNILFRPVILPCKHEFCKDCILKAMDNTAYQCPICRYRLSNWLRKVKDDAVVSESRENEIRGMFPSYYSAKEVGQSPCLSKSELKCLQKLTESSDCARIHVCSSGELHKDYLKELEKHSNTKLVEERRNEEASLALAALLLAEESYDMSENTKENVAGESSGSFTATNKTSTKLISVLSRTPYKAKKLLVKSTKKGNMKVRQSSKVKTLLEYAVDKRSERNCTADRRAEQVLRDEEFARKLQAEYSKVEPYS